MKIALVQQHAAPDKADNLARGLKHFDEAAAAGAKLVCFAELAFEPFYPQRVAAGDVKSHAEPIPGPITDAFSERARRHGVGPPASTAHPALGLGPPGIPKPRITIEKLERAIRAALAPEVRDRARSAACLLPTDSKPRANDSTASAYLPRRWYAVVRA